MLSEHMDHKQLVELFIERNMNFHLPDRAEETLKTVSYYKIKEFAKPYAEIIDSNIDYKEIYFEQILSRYYQDKNLRISILHAIEDIEVALQTQISYILGMVESNGYGYLNFSKWCNREEYCRHYLMLKENYFKRDLSKAMRRGVSDEIKTKIKIEKKKYPPIWLAIDLLTFGQLVSILELMSTPNLKKVSSQYKCSNEELVSWLKTINLVRNICAHNSNIIDIKLKTMPIIKEEWKSHILKTGKHMYTNRLALIIVILKYLLDQISPKYNFSKVSNSIEKLCSDTKNAKYFGFIDETTIFKIDTKARRLKKRPLKNKKFQKQTNMDNQK